MNIYKLNLDIVFCVSYKYQTFPLPLFMIPYEESDHPTCNKHGTWRGRDSFNTMRKYKTKHDVVIHSVTLG